jgi:VWFA-related protein
MRRVFLVVVILGCAALVACLVAGQQQALKQMTMEVSIVATANNTPVEDLRLEDVTVKDNNKKQEILSFEKVVAGAPATADKPGLYNIVMLDCLNTTYRDLPENRLEILRVVNELSKAGSLTLIMLRSGPLRVVDDPGMQPPTLLRRFAAQGGQGLEGSKPNLDPYDWVFSEQLGLYQLFTPAGVFDRRRIEDSMGALRTIALNYQGRSGRKNLIWISQGYPITIGQNPTAYSASALGQSTPTPSRSNDLSPYAKDMTYTSQMLVNANVAVYPVDGRYLSVVDTQMSDQGNMQDLAKETGGVAYLSRRDVANAVREALNDTRTTYVLKYAMSNVKFDGSSHAIKVDTTRKGVKLRYRNGYFAPSQAPK